MPTGKKTVVSKWVYKLKLKPDGTVDRYKARLVAKGYHQIIDIDFFDSFSSMAKLVTVCLPLLSKKSWPIHQLDAFLHGHLNEEIYMIPPEGYSKAKNGNVLNLNVLYMVFNKHHDNGTMNLQVNFKIIIFVNPLMITAGYIK